MEGDGGRCWGGLGEGVIKGYLWCVCVCVCVCVCACVVGGREEGIIFQNTRLPYINTHGLVY